MRTRGIRNNNPANIRHGSKWKGLREIQTDRSFCQFTGMAWGVRALICLLRTYVKKYKLKSVRKIIYRWAPPQDHNNTEAYIDYCVNNISWVWDEDAEFLEVSDFDIDNQEGCWKLFYLCKAMCWMESQYELKYNLFITALNLL